MKTKIFNRNKCEISVIPSLIPSYLVKNNKGMKKKAINKNAKLTKPKSYTQALATNINSIINIKENFPNLLSREIEKLYKVVNNQKKIKPRINMMTKSLSCRQVIISIDFDNSTKILANSLVHIVNINSALRNIKSNIITNFIYNDYRGLIITTNNVTSSLDLSIIKNYVKNIDTIQSKNISFSYLLQSKSYLKILDIPYFNSISKIPINSSSFKQVM